METEIKTESSISIRNQTSVALSEIPVMPYGHFHQVFLEMLKDPNQHCVCYYAYPDQDKLKFIGCIANDSNGSIKVLSHEMKLDGKKQLVALTRDHYAMHIYEREIT